MSLESLLTSYHSRFSPPVGFTDPFGQKTAGRPTASPANALKASQDGHWIGEGLDLLKGELKAGRLEGAFGSGKMTASQTRRLLLRLVASGRQELGSDHPGVRGQLSNRFGEPWWVVQEDAGKHHSSPLRRDDRLTRHAGSRPARPRFATRPGQHADRIPRGFQGSRPHRATSPRRSRRSTSPKLRKRHLRDGPWGASRRSDPGRLRLREEHPR
jgi:hypothetical protein